MSLPLKFEPGGICLGRRDGVLYLSDSTGQRVMTWELTGLRTHFELPASSEAQDGLGQVVLRGDGALFLPRYGRGRDGAILMISRGHCVPLLGLDPARKRIGLTIAPDGAMYSAFYLDCHAPASGAVAWLTPEGEEVVLVSGLGKPVGVVASRDVLLVSDQARGQILRVPRRRPESASVWASVPQPDALCLAADGTLLVASRSGAVYRVGPQGGAAEVVVAGLQEPRGVAYDAATRRLFVADRGKKSGQVISPGPHLLIFSI